MKKINFLLVIAVLLASLGAVGAAGAQAKQFDGVSINVLTFTGPQIAEPLQRRAPDFTALTGATINVITVPFANVYQSILADQAAGTNGYQAFVFDPQWMVDFVTPGYLQDLTDYVNNDSAIQWDDIGQFFREFSASYNGKIYTIPLDGDFHMVYYRTDILEQNHLQPPKTWDDYLNIAKTTNGQDMNGDGVADFGSCIAKGRSQQSYWFISSVASGMLQSQGTSQGGFFDTDTFDPLTNNAAFIKALDQYKETSSYGPADEVTWSAGNSRTYFTSGRCALTLDWGDIGTLAIDPTQSVVMDKVGTVVLPGSTQVLDRATGELVDCDATTCPYAIDGVNHAPFAAYGGWSGAVSAAASDDQKAAAYAFLSYMTQPAQSNVDVTIGRTGFNPYRISQLDNLQPWLDVGMSQAAAENYLGAIKASLQSPNMMLDLRIPQNQQYQQTILDEVVSRFLAGELTSAEAGQEIFNRWNDLSNQIGRDAQKAAYLASLGISGGQ